MAATKDTDARPAPWAWRAGNGALEWFSNLPFPLVLLAFLAWPLLSLTLFPLAGAQALLRGDRSLAGDAMSMMFAPLIAVGVFIFALAAIVTWTPIDEFIESLVYTLFGWCWDIADGPMGPPMCAQR